MEEIVNKLSMKATLKIFFVVLAVIVLANILSYSIFSVIIQYFIQSFVGFFDVVYYWIFFNCTLLVALLCFLGFKIWKLKNERSKRYGYIGSAVFALVELLVFVRFAIPQTNNSLKEAPLDSTLKVSKVEGSRLYFTNGEWIGVGLAEMKYIGQMATINKAPYFILSGKICQECGENTGIFIWSPSDGPFKVDVDSTQKRYMYPGVLNNYETKELISESKLFYGSCIGTESILWIERNVNSKKDTQSSILIVSVINDTLYEERITELKKTHQLMKKVKDCKELKGGTFTIKP